MAKKKKSRKPAAQEVEPDKEAKILMNKVSGEVKDVAVAEANATLRNFTIEKDMASHIKKHFDKTFEGTWHCVVGKNFGCSVAYDADCMLFFQIEQHYFLLFKSTDED
jgi:dynein light chain LC8-type